MSSRPRPQWRHGTSGVILPDVNVLVHAHNAHSLVHEAASPPTAESWRDRFRCTTCWRRIQTWRWSVATSCIPRTRTSHVFRACAGSTLARNESFGIGFAPAYFPENRPLLGIGHGAPARDFLDRAIAASAKAGVLVHDADFRAGALHAAFFAASARPALVTGSRPRTPQIHCPMSTRRSRSMPVSMPRPCSMYTRSSVARLPEAPFA
jgi:hypothetical protein